MARAGGEKETEAEAEALADRIRATGAVGFRGAARHRGSGDRREIRPRMHYPMAELFLCNPRCRRQRALIGNSPRTCRSLSQIEQMADHRWPVLILRGNGHGQGSDREADSLAGNRGPFVVIDCSAIPVNLMESELFGHVKGAFTGAWPEDRPNRDLRTAARPSSTRSARCRSIQSKLLRVLQEKEFRPVGATHSRRSDFRVIAATNRDLAAESDVRFPTRPVFQAQGDDAAVASSRDRREDIPLVPSTFFGDTDIVMRSERRWGRSWTTTGR